MSVVTVTGRRPELRIAPAFLNERRARCCRDAKRQNGCLNEGIVNGWVDSDRLARGQAGTVARVGRMVGGRGRRLTADVVWRTRESPPDGGIGVRLEGLGVFCVHDVHDLPERPGRNPATGEKITIKARKTIVFRPSRGLK